MKTKILFPVLIPLVIGATLITCTQQKEATEKTTPEFPAPESAIAVKLASVVTRTESAGIRGSGLVGTETESRLSFKIPGIIARVYVKEGDNITKGQVLASLELTEIDAQVSLAKSNFEKMKRDFERGERLYKDSALTLEQFQNLTTGLSVAEDNYRIATFNRQYAVITAPSSGKVLRKFQNEGELVGAGAPVLQINEAGTQQWIVKTGLPDTEWIRVREGDQAIITLDAYSEPFTGKVTNINEGAEIGSGLYTVEVTIQAGNRKLASGLVATVEITPATKSMGKVIPAEALIEGNGHEAFVFTPTNDKTHIRKVKVKIGYIRQDSAFVTSGLEDIAEIINGGSAFLTETSTITIIK